MPKDVQSIDVAITFRRPDSTDGPAIWRLVRECKPLDENSMYCNLIQAEHFRDTCVVAEQDGEIVGWVSAYMVPNRDTLFVWQVAVSPAARGMGLGRRMLQHLMDRRACVDAERLNTTITPDNTASWAMFKGLARDVRGALSDRAHFTRDDHFDGRHATEHMVTITLPSGAARVA